MRGKTRRQWVGLIMSFFVFTEAGSNGFLVYTKAHAQDGSGVIGPDVDYVADVDRNLVQPHSEADEIDPDADYEDFAADADSDLGHPFEMPHPETGESGTWIPRWVEREHIMDAHRLHMCMKNAELYELESQAIADRNEAMDEIFADLELSREQARLDADLATRRLVKAEARLERRMRALWGLVGVSLGLAGTTMVLILR